MTQCNITLSMWTELIVVFWCVCFECSVLQRKYSLNTKKNDTIDENPTDVCYNIFEAVWSCMA